METLSLVVRLALVLLPAFAGTSAVAQSCSKHSPPYTVALLELYTSEGCDSCPPADRFVSGLRNLSSDSRAFSGMTADQVVPLSLHVDYWDYIGWKDSFAKHDFTERQRWLSDVASSHTVYTPEVFVGGRELRNWRSGLSETVGRINQRPAQADIAIALGKLDQGMLPVTVNASSKQGGKLFVALYENGLSTEVRTGENRGVTLKHDYVVREWLGPFLLNGEAGRTAVSRTVPVNSKAAAKNLGLAAFVQTDKGEVLQALALPLCGG